MQQQLKQELEIQDPGCCLQLEGCRSSKGRHALGRRYSPLAVSRAGQAFSSLANCFCTYKIIYTFLKTEAKIVRCQVNSVNILSTFIKMVCLFKTRQCSQTKGLGDTLGARGLQKQRRAGLRRERAGKALFPEAPFKGWGAVLIRLRQTRVRFPG